MLTFGEFAALVLARLASLIGLVSGITTILNALGIAVDGTAKETQANDILADTATIIAILQDPTFGLAQLNTNGNTNTATILTAISNVQQTGDPVTLPTTPPPGYGAGAFPSAGDIWAYPMPDTGQPAADMLEDAGLLAINMATAEVILPLLGRPFLAIGGTWWTTNTPNGPGGQPTIDMTAILPDDTLVTWLNRTSGYVTWDDNADGYAFVADDASGGNFTYTTQITESQFPALKESLVASGVVHVPPIFPGDAFVTLGATVALEGTTAVDGPMDGVLVAITAVPSKLGAFFFDGVPSYRNIGAIAFVGDADHVEFPQSLGFENAVYCPKSLDSAAKVLVRAVGGVTGTITPWIRTTP